MPPEQPFLLDLASAFLTESWLPTWSGAGAQTAHRSVRTNEQTMIRSERPVVDQRGRPPLEFAEAPPISTRPHAFVNVCCRGPPAICGLGRARRVPERGLNIIRPDCADGRRLAAVAHVTALLLINDDANPPRLA